MCVYIYLAIFFFCVFLANLLQGLNSSDSAVKEEAMAEAEKRLREEGASREEEESRTTLNRTVINTSVRAFPSEIKAGHSSGLASLKAQMEAFQECQNLSNPCHPLFKCQMDAPSVCQSGYFRCTQILLDAPCSFGQGFLCCCGFSQNICAVFLFFQDTARAEAVDAGRTVLLLVCHSSKTSFSRDGVHARPDATPAKVQADFSGGFNQNSVRSRNVLKVSPAWLYFSQVGALFYSGSSSEHFLF